VRNQRGGKIIGPAEESTVTALDLVMKRQIKTKISRFTHV